MRRWDVYRGRRAGGRALPSILLFVLVFLAVIVITIFFMLPSYLTYTKDSVKLELPFLRDEETADTQTEALAEATPAPDYSDVTAEIEVKTPDYSTLNLATGEGLDILQSVYVPYEQVNEAGLTKATNECKTLGVKALTLELKDESGILLWVSETDMAVNYALNGTWDMTDTIADLKTQGYYLTAVISCCVDNSLVSRNATVALKDAGGFPFSNTWGAWLDPWNAEVRQYIIDLCAELMNMGFDEVVLNHAEHPTSDVAYTRTMSGTLTRVACVTNFAIAVREGLADVMASTGAHLSALMDDTSLNDATVDDGQNLGYFLHIFDRVYVFTETYKEASQVIALGADSTERFVSIISWVVTGGSWALNYFAETGD